MRRIVLGCLAFALTGAFLAAERITEMEFRDKPIVDILVVLGTIGKVSVVPDRTVSGNATFFFAESDFDDAFSTFLRANGLYSRIVNGAFLVSRVYVTSRDGLVTVHAEGSEAEAIIERISSEASVTVPRDSLPRDRVSVHAEGVTPRAALELAVASFPAYEVSEGNGFLSIRRKDASPGRPRKAGDAVTKVAEGRYSVGFESVRVRDLVEEVASLEGKEVSYMAREDAIAERKRFSGKGAGELLALCLMGTGIEVVERDGIYHCFDSRSREISAGLKTSVVVPVHRYPVQDLLSLLAPEVSSAVSLKADRATNAVAVSGSEAAVALAVGSIGALDVPPEGREYARYLARNVGAKELVAAIPSRLLPIPPVIVPGDSAFIALVAPESKAELDLFIALADSSPESYPVRLKYARNEDILKNPPPSVAKGELADSGYPSLLFFSGSPERRQRFLRELALLDRPKPQVRYDILVLQCQDSNGLEWSRSFEALPSAGAEGAPPSDPSLPFAVTGKLSALATLGFDVVSGFGLTFAASLNLKLEERSARVFADTSLTAISGQEVKFQNTGTFRYRDLEIDPDTGKPGATGVTRELSSGLLVSLSGWVSGDGMVTVSLQATVSERGTEGSQGSNAPPATTERVVSTQVRTRSGVPIVVSGLRQRAKDASRARLPILGDLPLIGEFFGDRKETESDTEVRIYVVPRIVDDREGGSDAATRMLELYRDVAKGGK